MQYARVVLQQQCLMEPHMTQGWKTKTQLDLWTNGSYTTTQPRRSRRLLLRHRAVAFIDWCWWREENQKKFQKCHFGWMLDAGGGLVATAPPWTWILPLVNIFKNKTEQDTSSDCWRVKHSFFCEGTEQFVYKHLSLTHFYHLSLTHFCSPLQVCNLYNRIWLLVTVLSYQSHLLSNYSIRHRGNTRITHWDFTQWGITLGKLSFFPE